MSHQSEVTQIVCDQYEIRFVGPLPARWVSWFDGFQLGNLENGEVVLRGAVRDQSELFGVLEKIHNLNLKLLSVLWIGPLE